MDAPAIRSSLPSPGRIREAIRLYVQVAYCGQAPPEDVASRLRPESLDPAEWLMGDSVERDPADAPLEGVRSFALRLGNAHYRHMKLRLSRPPKDNTFLFCVDSHDAFLRAPAGSSDQQALEQLKENNAAVAAGIIAAWNQAGLPTERGYLKEKIRQARQS